MTTPKPAPKSNTPNNGAIAGLDSQQQSNASLIVQTAIRLGLSPRDAAIGVMTAMDESSLHNLKGGDRDSAGLFQQRPSQGWGTYAQVTNPQYATNTFFAHLQRVHNRDKITPWMVAQDVQRSAYSDGSNYKAYWEGPSHGFKNSAVGIANYYLSPGNQVPQLDPAPDPTQPPSLQTTAAYPGQKVVDGTIKTIREALGFIGSWQQGVEVIGSFFAALLWIFNVDHFMRFMLYVFGTIAVAVGLGLISFGAGKREESD